MAHRCAYPSAAVQCQLLSVALACLGAGVFGQVLAHNIYAACDWLKQAFLVETGGLACRHPEPILTPMTDHGLGKD